MLAFTWSNSDGTLSSRIDLIGCPFPWLHYVSSCSVWPCPYSDHSDHSDHSGVLCVCTIPVALSCAPGPWTLNVSVREVSHFINLMNISGGHGGCASLHLTSRLGGIEARPISVVSVFTIAHII